MVGRHGKRSQPLGRLESFRLDNYELDFSESFSFRLYVIDEDNSNYIEELESYKIVRWAKQRGMPGDEINYDTI